MAGDWSRVKDVLGQALECDRAERGAFVARACAGEPALQERVERLLAAQTAADAAFSAPQGPSPEPPIPSHIGRYAIRRLIAVGGMGVVYEAEQESPHRRIALKVTTSVMTRSGAARFRQEGEILGRLQHPGIAQIYEAGIDGSNSGQRPFLAMEFVEGRPLTLHAQESGGSLNLRRRVALMVQVCEAVHHAHVKGVVHRDLKPDNIFVDVNGRAKVLDFGIARLADAEGATVTQAGEIVGTVPYMSPEQLAGDRRDIDARSDVYALGVVLHELLCGRRPHDLTGCTFAESVRLVCEAEPTPLGVVNPACRGDLQLITAKALERDPARRYQSAAELGADLARYLADEPVLARPPTVWYQLRKLARRNRALAAGVLAGFACLTAGLAIAGWQAVRASNEAASAMAINSFLQETLGAANPYSVGKKLSVIELLDSAAEKIPARFADRPLLAATLRATIGNAYYFQGDLAKAEAQLRSAWDIRSAQLGPYHPLSLESADMLGRLQRETGAWPESRILLSHAVEGRRRVLGPKHHDTLWSMHNLAFLIKSWDGAQAAEPMMREAKEGLEGLGGPKDPDAIWTATIYANLLGELGSPKAEDMALDAFQRSTAVNGEDHPHTLICQGNLSNVCCGVGRFDEAARLATDALTLYERTLGLEHRHALNLLECLATARQGQGRFKEAEELFRKLAESRSHILGERNQRTLSAYSLLILVLHRRGAFEEAEQIARSVLEGWRAFPGSPIRQTSASQCDLARLLADIGPQRCAEAKQLAQSAYDDCLRRYGPRDFLTIRAADALALALRGLGHADDGRTLLTEVLAATVDGNIDAGVLAMARGTLGGCWLDAGNLDRAQSDLVWANQRLARPNNSWFPGLRRVLIDLAEVADRKSDTTAAAKWRERLAALDRGE